MRKNNRITKVGMLLLGIWLIVNPLSTAYGQSSSTNYRLEEAYFGTGGEVDSSSTSYRSRQSSGALGVGNTSSTSYDGIAGNITPSDIFLEVLVTGPDVSFGVLSPSTTSYAASQGGVCGCSFYVRSYLSSEYVVVTASQPPTSENNISLTAKSTQGAPSGSTSVEEFGINLVANTAPGTFGAVPVNEPDGTFADGRAATGYEVTNQYKYGVGDIIARTPATAGNQGVGKTNYTISYIAKPSNTTSAGFFSMQHNIIVTPTF